MLQQRSEPRTRGHAKACRARFSVTTLIALAALAALQGARPVLAQEAPPDTLTDERGQNGAAKDQDRARLEERVRELRKELAATEKKLAEPTRQAADAGNSRGDRTPTAENGQNGSSRAPRRGNEARLAGERTEPAGRERGAAASTGAGASPPQIDLVQLANTLVDATGEYKLARITLDARDKLKAAGAFNEMEYAGARARMETAERRLTVLRSMAQVALESAQAHLERLEKLREQGVDTAASIEDATGRVKMLAVIVKGAE
jgi:hypothetical protein